MHGETFLDKVLEALLYGVLAFSGGVLGDLTRSHEDGTRFSWSRSLLKGTSAAFVGVLTWMFCRAMALDGWWVGLIVGLLSWLGAEVSIGLLQRVVYQKLGLGPVPKARKEED